MEDDGDFSPPYGMAHSPQEPTSMRRRGQISHSNVAAADLIINHDSIDILQWEDDDIALKHGASCGRLPHDKLTAQELACFPDVPENRASVELFLFIRNKTLQMWHLQPTIELTVDNVFDELPPPYNSDQFLVRRIHGYLQRYGWINYGIFTTVSAPVMPLRRRVIIIGAGVAGMAAARQLQFFGFDVTILEARQRTGGRVFTFKKPNPTCAADLGAMIIMGIVGNPLVTLAQQSQVTLNQIQGDQCPLYDNTGRPVERRKDRLIERAFNRLMNAAAFMAHTRGITEVDGETLSLGYAYDVLLKQQEYRQQARRTEFWQTYQQVLAKITVLQNSMVLEKKTLERLHALLHDFQAREKRAGLTEEERTETEISLKCTLKDIRSTAKRYDAHDGRRKELEITLAEVRKNEPSEVYMNASDKRILDFHFANLEYANGTNLNNCSLAEWNQDDDYECEGSHMSVSEGLGTLVNSLTQNLNIQLGYVVDRVRYNADGVEVSCSHNGLEETFSGEVCLCTVPLGVLKRSLKRKPDAPAFEPPLPQWKQDAIERLGFGNLNKVVLIFEKPFWDQVQVFGHVSDASSSRGEFYVFYAIYKTPVLIGMLAGEAANACEKIDEKLVVAKAMCILCSIYGPACPKEPLDSTVTKWRTDPFSRGCYSHIPPGASGDEYDQLAAPVKDETHTNRLFFAGEHTNRNYPASVHGALMSGFREAGRIADQILGCPYSPVEAEPEEPMGFSYEACV